jgi:hypothetical protein
MRSRVERAADVLPCRPGFAQHAGKGKSGCNVSRLGRVCVLGGGRHDALSDHDDLPMCADKGLTVAGPTPVGFGAGFGCRQ